MTDWRVFFSLSFVSLVWGCASDPPERPPPIQSSTGASTGPVAGGGGDDEPSSGGAPATTADGKVARFTDATFTPTEAYAERARIWMIGDSTAQQVDYDGSTFAFDPPSSERWLAVVPEFDKETLPTLTLWDPLYGSPSPFVVRRATVSEILGGLIDAATINDARAQVLVQVVADDGKSGLAGVVPTVAGGPDVAFEDNGVWSDFDDRTSQSGLFLAFNLFATDLPGSDVRVILTGTMEAEFPVRVATGAVTFVRYVSP